MQWELWRGLVVVWVPLFLVIVDSILLKFHFETIEPSIRFIVNQLQNFKNFGIIKVRNK